MQTVKHSKWLVPVINKWHNVALQDTNKSLAYYPQTPPTQAVSISNLAARRLYHSIQNNKNIDIYSSKWYSASKMCS